MTQEKSLAGLSVNFKCSKKQGESKEHVPPEIKKHGGFSHSVGLINSLFTAKSQSDERCSILGYFSMPISRNCRF